MPREKKDKVEDLETLVENSVESALQKLALGMLQLQEVVTDLASRSNNVNTVADVVASNSNCLNTEVYVDKSYLSNWRELGGSTLYFNPNAKLHPKAFINKIKKIFHEAGVPQKSQVGLAIGCLRGNASDWGVIKEASFETFQDFEQAFLNRFWGVEKQRDLFMDLNYGQFKTGNMADYFLHLAGQAAYLSEPIPEVKLISMLTKHFPGDVQRGIITQGFCLLDEVEEYLRRLDETPSTWENDSRRPNRDSEANSRSNNNRPNTGNRTRNAGDVHHASDRAYNINNITTFNQEFDDILSDPESDNEETPLNMLPVVVASVYGVCIEILIDSGSPINAISEKLFGHLSGKGTLPILPVNKLAVGGSLGGGKERVSRQVMLPVSIADSVVDIIFFVVPKLNKDILLGYSWLVENKGLLLPENKTFTFSYKGRQFEIPVENGAVDTNMTINCCQVASDGSVKHQYSKDEFKAVVSKASATHQTKDRLFDLIYGFSDIFSESPGLIKSYSCDLQLTNVEPFNSVVYPVPFVYKPIVKQQIDEMVKWGVIERAKVDYVSPLVCVKKKDKSIRICLDARQLNQRLKKDYVNPPNQDDLLFNFKRGQVFSTIDLTASYWQILINPAHRQYIGFCYEGETYAFCRLPFGLSISMACLIRCLKTVLTGCEEFVNIYVDDIQVHSESVDEHLSHLKKIFDIFREEGVTVKLRKCQFLCKTILFLGHQISSEGIQLDNSRTDAISKFPAPRNVKELRAFLGLVNYERRFCEGFSGMTVPMLKLLRKREPWCWGSEQKEAFDKIKQAFLNATIIMHPDCSKTFYIQCDGSDYAIGGTLFQRSLSGEREVLAYTSVTLKGSQLRYTVTEKEMMALVHCLRQWRNLILGRKLIVITDHKALSFLLSCKLKSSRISRWIMFVQEFNFDIIHCAGKDNVVADTLSRFPADRKLQITEYESGELNLMLLSFTEDYKKLKQNFSVLRDDQLEDRWIQEKINFLEGYSKSVTVLTQKELSNLKWFAVHQGLLFKKGDQLNLGYKLCVPATQVKELVVAHHNQFGHFGKSKTYNHMREKFYWPRMQHHIRQIVSTCDLCQKAKCSIISHGPLNCVVPDKPGDLVALDLIGPLPVSQRGATQILVIVDCFSRYVRLYALKRATCKSILSRIFLDYIEKVQKPRVILSDNGTQFRSKEWSLALSKQDIKAKLISVYFPEGNMTERYNREVGRLLRTYCNEKHTRWATALSFVEDCLNSSISEVTGCSPHYVQFGTKLEHPIHKHISFPLEVENLLVPKEQLWVWVKERVSKRTAKRIAKFNEKLKPVTFNPGDQVLIRTHRQSSLMDKTIKKFFLLYEGPYLVLRVAGPNSYDIGDAEGRELGKHNVVNLKPYKALREDLKF